MVRDRYSWDVFQEFMEKKHLIITRQLKSVRLFVAGAEKAPKALFEHVKRLGATKEMIEGYGITECSPIVTLNRQGRAPKGVGQPIPGVELCVIHPETHEKIPNDQQGSD